MKPGLKGFPTLLLVVGFIACSTLFIQSANARAKAGVFDDEEEDGDSWGWGNSKEEIGTKTGDNSGSVANVDHSSHNAHQHSDTSGASGVQNPSSWDQSGGGYGGGNLAAFNESCGIPPKKSCAKAHELQCSTTDGTGSCICTPHHTYIRQTEKCWLIAKSDQNDCDHDAQCHAGVWGAHSRCNKHTRQCECYDFSSSGKRDMTEFGGVCFVKKLVGEACKTDEECDKTIEGGASCKGEEGRQVGLNYNGTCQCRETHMFWKALEACLKLSTKLDDVCRITEQCKEGSLGRFSRCSPEFAKCECFSPHNGTEVVYYERLAKCFKRKEYNDTCENEDQCKASLGPDAECGSTDDYPDAQVCHCPKGKVCRSSAFSMMAPSFTTTLGLACSAAAIGVSSVMHGIGFASSG